MVERSTRGEQKNSVLFYGFIIINVLVVEEDTGSTITSAGSFNDFDNQFEQQEDSQNEIFETSRNSQRYLRIQYRRKL